VVGAISKKQKLVTKSSTEAELVALCDATSWVLYCREFLEGLGVTNATSVLHEDNKSVLDLLSRRNPATAGSKHIRMRYFFTRQHMESKEIETRWCGTGDMWADMMTKPLVGKAFAKFRDATVPCLN